MSVQIQPAKSGEVGPLNMNWKTQNMIVGAVIGLVIGLLAAYLYVRAADENIRSGKPNRMETMDGLKLGLAALGLIRQIAEIGGKSAK